MKTIAIASQKGGAGKTSLARNLAVAATAGGRRVVLLDLDPQKTLTAWWNSRTADFPELVEAHGTLAATVQALDAAGFDWCVIDTPPAAGLADIFKVADLVLIPARPSGDDLRALPGTLDALHGTPFAFVITQAPPRARLVDEAARVLASHGRVAPVNIGQRVSYAEAAMTGEGVTESGDARAADEIREVLKYVEGLV